MSTKLPLINTADQLLAAADELGPCELVRGELIMMTPAGEEHSQVEGNIYASLRNHVRSRKLGRVYMGDAGFLRHPHRAPSLAGVRDAR